MRVLLHIEDNHEYKSIIDEIIKALGDGRG
jgi:hypothetical protein